MKNALLALAAMGIVTASCAAGPGNQGFAVYDFDASREHVGRIYHYLRSNRDGSLPEHIYIYHKSRSQIEVYKMVRPCVNAALVTADLDYDLWSPTRLVGGRLLRDAKQEGFAVLTLDASAARLDAVVTLPSQKLEQSLYLKSLPWRLYDFDFADFTIFAQHLADYGDDFSTEMALLLADPDNPDFLRRLGAMEAAADGLDPARKAYRFRLKGEAFPAGGVLLLDAKDGHVIEVETLIPNHLEYDDFRLTLISTDDGGAPAWRGLLLKHFEGCDEPN